MTITEYAATTARGFMAAEIAMAAVQLRSCERRARKRRNCLTITLPTSNGRSLEPRNPLDR
jgi:hypothetical protein